MRAVRMHISVSTRRLRLRRVFALFVLATFGTAACGSTTAPGSADAPPPSPPASATFLDFSAIAGEWEGTVTETNQPAVYPVQIALDAEAALGARVGTVDYLGGLNCGGNLMAREASDGSYVLDEFLTYGSGCIQGGRIRLMHNAAAGTLDYEWYFREKLGAIAELIRKE